MDGEQRRIIYRHRQLGMATALGLLGGGLTQAAGAVRAIRSGRRRAWWYLPWVLLYAAVMYVFSSLTVEIDEETVRAAFTNGIGRRTFRLDEIEDASVVDVAWYSGWGMRYTSFGWLYAVWGRRAVQLQLTDDRQFTIGTDEPEALKAAVDAARFAAGE
jgi:hypothetical protein